jgi:hypothetical protein
MARRKFDPLTFIPSPDVLRRELAEYEDTARRLRILLEVSEKIHSAAGPAADDPKGARKAVSA